MTLGKYKTISRDKNNGILEHWNNVSFCLIAVGMWPGWQGNSPPVSEASLSKYDVS